MNLRTLTDRQLMQHWDVAARICVATLDRNVSDHYIDRMKAIHVEMDRQDAERDKHMTQEEKRARRRNPLKWRKKR